MPTQQQQQQKQQQQQQQQHKQGACAKMSFKNLLQKSALTKTINMIFAIIVILSLVYMTHLIENAVNISTYDSSGIDGGLFDSFRIADNIYMGISLFSACAVVLTVYCQLLFQYLLFATYNTSNCAILSSCFLNFFYMGTCFIGAGYNFLKSGMKAWGDGIDYDDEVEKINRNATDPLTTEIPKMKYDKDTKGHLIAAIFLTLLIFGLIADCVVVYNNDSKMNRQFAVDKEDENEVQVQFETETETETIGSPYSTSEIKIVEEI